RSSRRRRLFEGSQQRLRLLLEVFVFWRPLRIQRRVDRPLQRRARVLLLLLVDQRLAEKEEGCGALLVVGERLAQVFFRFLVAAAEQARHPEVPAAERAISGTLLKGGIDPQDRLQLVLDLAAILQSLAQPERFGEGAHVRRDPEMALGPLRL